MKYLKLFEEVKTDIVQDMLYSIQDEYGFDTKFEKTYFIKRPGYTGGFYASPTYVTGENVLIYNLYRVVMESTHQRDKYSKYKRANTKGVNELNRYLNSIKEYYSEETGKNLLVFVQHEWKKYLFSKNNKIIFYITEQTQMEQELHKYFNGQSAYSNLNFWKI